MAEARFVQIDDWKIYIEKRSTKHDCVGDAKEWKNVVVVDLGTRDRLHCEVCKTDMPPDIFIVWKLIRWEFERGLA